MATASSKTASSFHNMPYRNGTFMANHGTNSSAEVTPDLHLKMSKKIAQLTKVIYALNTKNDEHETSLEVLKTVHEEEMQQLITETKEKMSYFKSRLGDLGEQKRKVELLETHVHEEQLWREEAITEFEMFKTASEDKEAALRSEFSNKILSMSKELLTSKRQFEDRLKDFHLTRKRLEEDRDKAIEELTGKHHDELDQLMKAHRVRYDEVVKEKIKLENEYKQKLSQVYSSNELSATEIKKLEGEYQEKIDKLKAFYEKELEVIRTEESNTRNELVSAKLKEWEQRERGLKLDWNQQERKYKDRISELFNQLNFNEEQMSELKSQLKEFETQLAGKDVNSSELVKELEQARRDHEKALGSLRDVETGLSVSRKRCTEQGEEIARQSAQISKYEVTRLSKEVAIKNLKSNITEMQDKVSSVQSEHDKLDKKFKTHYLQAGSQIKSLEESINKLTKEKEELDAKYQHELNRAQENSSDKETSLRKELEDTVTRLKINHERKLDSLHLDLKTKLSDQERELLKKSDQEREDLTLKKNKVIGELETECNELRIELYNMNMDVKRLEGVVQEGEKGLGSVSSQVSNLQQALSETRDKLQKAQNGLADAHSKSQSFQDEIQRLNKLLEVTAAQSKEELQAQLRLCSKELDTKWSDKLREDCCKLQSELDEKYKKENESSLEQLRKLTELEQSELKRDLEHRIDVLKQTVAQLTTKQKLLLAHSKAYVTELHSKLEKSTEDATVSQHQIRQEADRQTKMYEENIAKLMQEHNMKLKEIEEAHAAEIKKLTDLKEQELKDIEEKLMNRHRDSITSQLQANKLAVEAVKSQVEQQRIQELAELKKQYENEQELLRNELIRKQQEEMLKLNRDFQNQLSSLTLQLQRANQVHIREREESESKLDDLRSEVEQRDSQLVELDEEIAELKRSMEKLQHEITEKGQEILTIRREANSQLRQREEQLAKSHQKEVDSLVADHLRETQALLGEFNRAQDLLKDKISALQIMLEEAEDRYRNRDSRVEDLEMIDMLKRMLAERELEMKKLVDEKRYFQLELMNRETNFNKVFKRPSPSVGVINPLQAKTKPGKSSSKGSTGSLVSTTRLDPIPHSLTHQKRLNNQQPLPPTPPKDAAGRRTVVY